MYMYDHCMYIHAYVNCKFFKAEISIIYPVLSNISESNCSAKKLMKADRKKKMATYIIDPQETKVHQIHTIRQCTTQIGPSINKRNCVLSYNSPLANNTVSSHFRASFLLKLSKEPRKRERRRFMESTNVGRKVFNPLLFYAVKPIHQTSLMLSAIIQAAIK